MTAKTILRAVIPNVCEAQIPWTPHTQKIMQFSPHQIDILESGQTLWINETRYSLEPARELSKNAGSGK